VGVQNRGIDHRQRCFGVQVGREDGPDLLRRSGVGQALQFGGQGADAGEALDLVGIVGIVLPVIAQRPQFVGDVSDLDRRRLRGVFVHAPMLTQGRFGGETGFLAGNTRR